MCRKEQTNGGWLDKRCESKYLWRSETARLLCWKLTMRLCRLVSPAERNSMYVRDEEEVDDEYGVLKTQPCRVVLGR